jgi:ABC-type sulfate/molybdate transport systems ATPase subunit
MQRRLELACALVHEPDLLILDEPTAGIDPLLRRTVWDELHRLRDRGVTALVTTQYVTEAEECDEVALIADGRLVAFGTPMELRRQALGGEVVSITTKDVFDAEQLSQHRLVNGVQQAGLRDFQVIVEDAGLATADIVEAVEAAGGEVVSVREHRPTFEEVFARLVERSASAEPAESAGPTADGADGDGDAGAGAGAETEAGAEAAATAGAEPPATSGADAGAEPAGTVAAEPDADALGKADATGKAEPAGTAA